MSITIHSLRGRAHPPEAGGRWSGRIESATIAISQPALELLLPPGIPLRVVHVRSGQIRLHLNVRGGVELVIRPAASDAGSLRIDVLSARLGILPVPRPLITKILRDKLPRKPGIQVQSDGSLELDHRMLAATLGWELPPLKRARVLDGLVEFCFEAPGSLPEGD